MAEGTTPTGVPQKESAVREEGGPYRDELHPRRSIMADIAKSAREQREDQFSERDGSEEDEQRKTEARMDPEPEPEPEPEQPAEPPAAEPERQTSQPQKPEPSEPTVMVEVNGEMVEVPASKVRTKTKINGQEQEVAGTDLLRGYQMTSAGQARLREAREMQRQIEQRERDLQAREQQMGQQPQGQDQRQTNTRQATTEEEAAKIAHALQFGDEKESAEAVKKLTELSQSQGRTDSGATPDDMVNAVYERVSFEVQDRNAYQSGIDSFRNEYPHLVNDPGLARLATDYVNQVRARNLSEIGYDVTRLTPQQMAMAHAQEAQKGTVPGYGDTFREAGQLTDRWLQHVSGARTQAQPGQPAPAEQPSSSFDARQEAKRRTAQPPRTASGRASAAPSKPQLQTGATPGERVEWLRQQRGQA